MPNISSLTMPDGIVYSIKDSIARKDIEEIKKSGSAGSGGSSGGGSTFVVEVIEDTDGYTTTAVFQDAKQAFLNGQTVLFNISGNGNNVLTIAANACVYGTSIGGTLDGLIAKLDVASFKLNEENASTTDMKLQVAFYSNGDVKIKSP